MTFKRTNPLALAVLALLSERPMHPYEMAQTMRERHQEEVIKLNYGSLYTVVETLHKHELITASATQKAGNRPERTVYAVTDTGTAELHDWLRELIAVPAKEYPRFEAGISLVGLLPPDDALLVVEQARDVLFVRRVGLHGDDAELFLECARLVYGLAVADHNPMPFAH